MGAGQCNPVKIYTSGPLRENEENQDYEEEGKKEEKEKEDEDEKICLAVVVVSSGGVDPLASLLSRGRFHSTRPEASRLTSTVTPREEELLARFGASRPLPSWRSTRGSGVVVDVGGEWERGEKMEGEGGKAGIFLTGAYHPCLSLGTT
ncbi:hypothetical protein Purlil1_11010 [Purpureocillium lilacinum]|uniref:Uncharacterized protein n=1 Tax=Purpureocillium lilacinum TaxID=33203 RepID=A0ABR0BKV8_PURLI|nr:hypothetical protein Purlil1_11010 [Purpureocillium lilacinum]